MKVLKLGTTGALVQRWQIFLRGQGHSLDVTGSFDDPTDSATRRFQETHGLVVDGKVGNRTFGQAGLLGFELTKNDGSSDGFPSAPDFKPLIGNAARQKLFGPLESEPAPTSKNPEAIRITNDWENNLVRVVIPQLIGIPGARADGKVQVHRLVAKQMLGVWKAFADAGLLKMVLSFDGLYSPRYVRGGAASRVLSNHAFATAFDINYQWNKLGVEPAESGKVGCVYELVPIAHRFGFYWGGHFRRRDGMHFEVARVLD